jgi:hypothetical protein
MKADCWAKWADKAGQRPARRGKAEEKQKRRIETWAVLEEWAEEVVWTGEEGEDQQNVAITAGDTRTCKESRVNSRASRRMARAKLANTDEVYRATTVQTIFTARECRLSATAQNARNARQ